MKPSHPGAKIHVPDGTPIDAALSRITHLGIGAHQDDLEFMAFHGICACLKSEDRWFGGVTCTDGAGSVRAGDPASGEEWVAIRQREQDEAADLGNYGIMIQLGFPSDAVKKADEGDLVNDLIGILRKASPKVVYTHNPTDKHPTHVAIFAAVLRALRSLTPEERPETILGCEVWRGLDWLPDGEAVRLDVSGHEKFAEELHGVFASQNAGKRYDRAVRGRWSANATFYQPGQSDREAWATLAMDLSPLVQNPAMDVVEFATRPAERLRRNIRENLLRYFPSTGGGSQGAT